ncbi:MAG: lactate/malate dehydrogenase family protein [Planctomycetota bacterium]
MKITIVGTGRVGSAIAFAMTINPLASELVLVNRSRERAEGDAMDLSHASALQNSNMAITAGDIADSSGSDVIVFTASVPMEGLGETKSRLDMAVHNIPMLRDWIPKLAQASPDAVIIMVTNPVDAMTFATIQLSGFPAARVIGTGTLVDSVRYRSLLSRELQIHSEDIRAYILGEHGDTQFAAESIAMTGGEQFYPTDTSQRLYEQTVNMGYEVYRRKGHTCYGIALATTTIVDSIAYDLRHTMPVSVLIEDFLDVRDVCLSLPAVIGRHGVTRVLHPELSQQEKASFRHCADVVGQTIAKLDLAL